MKALLRQGYVYLIRCTLEAQAKPESDLGLPAAMLGGQVLPSEGKGQHILHRVESWPCYLPDGEDFAREPGQRKEGGAKACWMICLNC
jgi:hypothetical protein